LEEYGIDPKDPVEKKYKSKAGDYSRKYLKNLVENPILIMSKSN